MESYSYFTFLEKYIFRIHIYIIYLPVIDKLTREYFKLHFNLSLTLTRDRYIQSELGTILKKCIIDTITHFFLIIDTTTITLKKIIVDTITNTLFS